MRWFMDSEFAEDGRTIKLISIALVSERGDYYYACALDGWTEDDCDDWVKANVLTKLPPRDSWQWLTRAQIRSDLERILLADGDKPELWAYFADYDWVVMCQLFGRMVDLPAGMPRYCRDLKQEMDRLGIRKDMLQKQPDNAHDALADARWVRSAWLQLFGAKE